MSIFGDDIYSDSIPVKVDFFGAPGEFHFTETIYRDMNNLKDVIIMKGYRYYFAGLDVAVYIGNDTIGVEDDRNAEA